MTRLLLTLLVAQSAPQLPNTPFLAPSDTMHATVSGRGEPVVLVPGLLGSGFAFRKVVHLLNEAGFRTVVVDLLGTGRSTRSRAADYSLEAQAGRIAFVLDTLGVTNARVVAHAIGGSIVMRMTLQRPDLVSALLLLLEAGPAESAATDGLRKALKFGPLIKLLGAGPVKGRMRDQMVEASGDPSWVEADVVEGYARGTVEDLGATLDVFRAMSSAREPEALAPRLAEIREPVRLCWAARRTAADRARARSSS